MTHPGVPVSPGFPALDHTAQQAIRMAQDRLGVLTRGSFPLPVKKLSDEEKTEALKSAKESACRFCAGLHPGASTPACPRLATFKTNGDGEVTEGSYWPESVTDSAIDLDKDGNLIGVHHEIHVGWNTDRVVFIEDITEDGEDGTNGAHPA
jgi:hypothetical protein